MRAMIRMWIVYVCVVWGAVAHAQPAAEAHHKRAERLFDTGRFDEALVDVAQGLAAVKPKTELSRKLHFLRGRALLRQLEHLAALEANKAFIADGAKGEDLRTAQNIVTDLKTAETTSLVVTVEGGPASVTISDKLGSAKCPIAASCTKSLQQGTYEIFVEREGFEDRTLEVELVAGKTTQKTVALVEKPSPLEVRTTPADAVVEVDGTPYDPKRALPPGRRVITVSRTGHAPARVEVVAARGAPITQVIALVPVVAVRGAPPGAKLQVDGKPPALHEGGLVLGPGPHQLVVTASGYQPLAPVAIPAERPEGYAIDIAMVPLPPRAKGLTLRRQLAIGAAGLGVVAAGAGAYLGVRSGRLESDAFALCPSASEPCDDAREATALNQQAQDRARQANIAFGIAGGAVVAAAALWLTGAAERPRQVTIAPQVGGAAVVVRF